MQILGLDNPSKTFTVQNMLAGFRKTKPLKEIRCPITYQVLLKILLVHHILPTVIILSISIYYLDLHFQLHVSVFSSLLKLTSVSNNINKNVLHL